MVTAVQRANNGYQNLVWQGTEANSVWAENGTYDNLPVFANDIMWAIATQTL